MSFERLEAHACILIFLLSWIEELKFDEDFCIQSINFRWKIIPLPPLSDKHVDISKLKRKLNSMFLPLDSSHCHEII